MKTYIYISFILVCVLSCTSNTDSTTALKVEPVPKPDSWRLVWQDEFEYSGLPDSSYWTFETDGNDYGWGNGEDQYYTADRLENAEVKDGVLQIKALLEDYHPDFKYTSARINSELTGGWLYGRFEVRAKLPEGRGVWPAIWMLPVDSAYGSWPDSGEIDIMEYFSHLPNKSFSTIHTKTYNHKIGTSKDNHIYSDTLHDEFHNYSLEWYRDRLEFYFDNTLVMEYKNPYKTSGEWPFDKPFHLLLNCAIGGDWIRSNHDIDDTKFPHVFEIDYVRVYEGVYPGEHELKTSIYGGGHIEHNGEVLSEKLIFDSSSYIELAAVPEDGYVFNRWTGDISGSTNPLKLRLGYSKNISAVFLREGELIFNSSFAQGLSGWSFWEDNKEVMSHHYTENNTFNVDVIKKGSQIWQAQLNQIVELEEYSEYIVEFEASGTVENTKVSFQQAIDPYKSYWSTGFTVNKEWSTYSFKVGLKDISDSTRLEFNFGDSKGKFKLRNVSVRLTE